MKPQTFRQRLARAARDRSFIIGTVLVCVFVLVAVLGPELAPHDPYLRDRIQTIDGQLKRAPFDPCDLYPLGTDDQGRDMLSMLLHGARQTLVIAFVAMTVRLLLGLLLGTLAGWWPGSRFDRGVMAVTEFLSAVPTLVLAVLLVLTVGIRRGQISFVVALSLAGWGEVTQIIRGHVLVIRNKLYILASRAIGLGSAQLMSRHVLPNLLATLLALAALEMGGVLLLLGELGFVHIFVGGGGTYTEDFVGTTHYFDVPDWGAMLGTSWRYFRTLPWMPMAPALAFFAAVLGFNLFGYGLQRFIEKGRFHPSGWSLLRFFGVVGVVLLGARALLVRSSAEVRFAELAEQFDVQRAWNDVAYLTRPEMGGRLTGPGGGFEAAGYIAYQFEQAGLTPLENGTYYQSYEARPGRVITEPSLTIVGTGGDTGGPFAGALSFEPDYPFESQDPRVGPLTVYGNAPRVVANGVLLVLDEELELLAPYGYHAPKNAAVLHVVPDEVVVRDDVVPEFDSDYFIGSFPCLRIGETAAEHLLAQAGLDLDDLRESLEAGDRIKIETDLEVRVDVGVVYDEVSAANVVGYFPAADTSTEGDRILLVASYTGPRRRGEEVYPGADANASGVAVVMEVARLWHDLRFEPKRTVVFAAFDNGGGFQFVNRTPFPNRTSDRWTVVRLQDVGAGEPRLAVFEAGAGLARAFDDSARRFGVRTGDLPFWQFFFADGYGRAHQAYTGLVVTRPGDDLTDTPQDTLDHLDPALMRQTGQAVAHYLMVLSTR